MYDVKTETTIKGTVESVENVTGAGGRGHLYQRTLPAD